MDHHRVEQLEQRIESRIVSNGVPPVGQSQGVDGGSRSVQNSELQRGKGLGYVAKRQIPIRQCACIEIAEFYATQYLVRTINVADGSIAWEVDVQKDFENAPKTLLRLYTGANIGKQLLEL